MRIAHLFRFATLTVPVKMDRVRASLLVLTTCAAIVFSISPATAATFLVDPQYGFASTSNVVYGTSPYGNGGAFPNGTLLPRVLDIYQPTVLAGGPALPDTLPGVVLMHGGFFTGGDKSGLSFVAQEFAKRGYVATSINYRLLHELPDPPGALPATFPSRYPSWLLPDLAAAGVTIDQYVATIAAAVGDQGMAVNWLADNASIYNVDPSKIVVGGYSAGAVSSLLLGYGAVEGVAADVAAIASFAGGTFGLEVAAVDSDDPPTFLVHGDQDTTVPYNEYIQLQPVLDAAGVTSDSLILNGVGHGVGLANMTTTQMFTFLESQLTVVPEPSSALLLTLVGCRVAVSRRRATSSHNSRQQRLVPASSILEVIVGKVQELLPVVGLNAVATLADVVANIALDDSFTDLR